MKRYDIPTIEIVKFDAEDIITVSFQSLGQLSVEGELYTPSVSEGPSVLGTDVW